MEEININLIIQLGEEESVFLQRAVNAALQVFRRIHNEGAPLDTCPRIEPIRILVVDDFGPFRESLCRFFLTYETLSIVGEAADGEAAIEMAFRLAPQVIIMDVKLPRISGVEATRQIKRFLPSTHIIGVSSQDDSHIKEAMQAVGSSTFVAKDCAHTLPDVIAKITANKVAKIADARREQSSTLDTVR